MELSENLDTFFVPIFIFQTVPIKVLHSGNHPKLNHALLYSKPGPELVVLSYNISVTSKGMPELQSTFVHICTEVLRNSQLVQT